MTRVQMIIEDGSEEKLKEILEAASFKAEFVDTITVAEPESQYQKLKKILEGAKGKDLFKAIEDPSAWQREIRKEWERDI